MTEGTVFPARSLIMGSPARVVRTLDHQEVERLQLRLADTSRMPRVFAKIFELCPSPACGSDESTSYAAQFNHFSRAN
jgi:hypothetical protein